MQVKQDRATYSQDDVAQLLQARWTGAAYKETIIPEGMPRAKANPAHQGSDWAADADLSRALAKLGPQLHIKHLWLKHAGGLETFEIADTLGVPYEDAHTALEHDMELLTAHMNGQR